MSIQNRVPSWLIRGVGLIVAMVGLVPAETSARAVFQAAPPAIQIPNLVGYWCVDGLVPDTATVARDSSGNANHGTYTSGATSISAAPPIPAGNTKSFALTQASRQYIAVPDSPSLSITGAMTVAAWIRPTIDSTLQQGIVEKWDEPGATNGYMFRLDANENLDFSIGNAAGMNGVSTAPRAVPLNVWTHVAGVYSQTAGTITNYVNAAADPSVGTGIAAPTNGSYQLQIGGDHGANAFHGNLDEVRLYNKALTAPEVALLKNGQPAPTALIATGGTNQIQLAWTAASNAGSVPVRYSVLRGPGSAAYDTVFNDVMTPAYTDTAVTGGTPYYYAVVAVSVIASAPSNEQSATAAAGPPPPPPVPRTEKTGNQKDHMCGWSTASPEACSPSVLAAALAAVLLLMVFRRRAPPG